MDLPAIEGGTPIRDRKIFYGHQYIDDADCKAVMDVLKSDFLTCGPKIGELEEKLCKVTGAKHAVVCSNDTAALHISCMAAGIGRYGSNPDGTGRTNISDTNGGSCGNSSSETNPNGVDEVITTPMTFAASANCALYCGARPVFADIDPETYNIDPASIEAHITEHTKAVVAVDYTGQAVKLDEIKAICKKHNLVLIEDAAHAIGTKYKGQAVGSIADMTTFSFHPVKTITGGEGGAILTDNDEYYQKLLLYRSHGITHDASLMNKEPDGPWYYQQIDLGYNYRMTDIQAALLISQLDKLPSFSKRRKEIVAKYNEAFADNDAIFVQKEIPESDTTRHLYILRLIPEKLKIDRRQFFDALGAENIVCNVHYIPVYYFPYYQKMGYKKGLCPNAEKLYDEEITLPLFYAMTDEDVESVIKAVNRITAYYHV